ncbi:excinuclease ABC subunit UvrA [Saccharopolyspora indica]|uniref:excinuclease ABC subunit UvrA n=1 Tax=Saccharopolyspora indica TaxID=1229659 RepID=UPI0022EAA53D|nr:excinuclease ABC subunit UvrA [Saccharopolyspora indica]MDA3647034.1 excinuclease ABC subunit UvrA [Saccharopolyspora indica]
MPPARSAGWSDDWSSTIPGYIEVRGARENNLKNVSLDIPKKKITVFTGVSGSGKSSLAFGTIAAESQRLFNETYPAFIQSLLPSYGQPDADSIANMSAAIVVDQQQLGGNSRSTVGTATDLHTLLRLLYTRIGEPAVGNAKELSFNDPQGMCPECEGIGHAAEIDLDRLLDRDKSLNEGAIRFPTFEVDTIYWGYFVGSGLFDNDKALRDFTEQEWQDFLHLPSKKVKVKMGGTGTVNVTYEGLLPKFRRLYVTKGADQLQPHLRGPYREVVTTGPCKHCEGSRLNAAARECRIEGTGIADCAAMQLSDLAEFVRTITEPSVGPLVSALLTRLDNLVHIGLGYLTLDRPTTTLSGGESQRLKLVRHLSSSLTDMTYVFDEPGVGLHPQDVQRLNELLIGLRDKGNTVLVVEHRPAVMAIADHLVDMGPAAGQHGGEVVFQGEFAGLRESGTLTGEHLDSSQPVKAEVRKPDGKLSITGADSHNLRDVSVDIPTGVLTAVTGVAGAGKSTLIREHLVAVHPDVVFINQHVTRGSKRSNPATYTGILDPIRKAFATANKVSAALFSANSKGACPDCQGLGLIYTDLAHLEPVVSTCETCQGKRFNADVLKHTLRGRDISEVLRMSVTDALEFFTEPAIAPVLRAMEDVGLGYLTLWQPLSTLSGGERQRLKLALELEKTGQVYVLEEPTTGLHMNDVDKLVGLLDRLVDNGSTVVVIEHNLDVIARADWVVDLGPGAGRDGGQVVFEGPPAKLLKSRKSVTAKYLAQHQKGSAGKG